MKAGIETKAGWAPLATGLVIGLGWGQLLALVEGLPLLLQGEPWFHFGQRLLALALLLASYGFLWALAGTLLGLAVLLVLRLAGRAIARHVLAAAYAGIFAAATLAILWGQRFAPQSLGWGVIGVLALGAGLGLGCLLRRAARGRLILWRELWIGVVAVWGLALVTVLATMGLRAGLRDAALFHPAATDAVATAGQPNVVLITAGGLRPDHLGVYGYDPAISPHVDALARRGVRFEQAFAQASWTVPSLASLLTSLYPSELGIACTATRSCQPHLDTRRLTLAEALQAAGYRTQAYLTSPWLTEGLGFAQGFDGFESVRAEAPFDLGPLLRGTLGRSLGCERDSAACRLLAGVHGRLFETPIPAGWGGDHVNARVGRFLELHGGERFFLWVHYTEALPPYDLGAPFRPLPDDPLASPENRLRSLGYWELGDPFAPREELLPRDVEGLTSLYDAEVHRVDRLVGGVTAQLEAHDLTGQTLVVLAADHGQEFMEHGGYTYGHSLYDEVLRVPLIIAWPGVTTPGRGIETPVGLIDLLPTLLEMVGVPLPPEAEGRSLVAALAGGELEERPVYSESLYRVANELKARRGDGYTLIYDPGTGCTELYDRRADPGEQRDLAAVSPEVAAELRDELLAWLDRVAGVARTLPRDEPPAEFREAVW